MDVEAVYDAEAEQRGLAEVIMPRYKRMLEAWQEMVASQFPELTPDEFRLDDAATRRQLAEAADRVVMIDRATQDAIREQLQKGQEKGYSSHQLAYGVPADGFRGIDGLFTVTWASRAETVARTELAHAQNRASLDRYAATGVVDAVELVENDDTDAPCADRNGTVVPLTEKPGLLHPNCRLAIIPVVNEAALETALEGPAPAPAPEPLPEAEPPPPTAEPSAPWLWADDEIRFDAAGRPARPGWEADVLPAEQAAARDYTTGAYRDLNERLRDGTPLTPEQTALRTHLDSVIAKAGEYAEPPTVWRGVNMGNAGMPPGHALAGLGQAEREPLIRSALADYAEQRFTPGETVRLGGYQSTSFQVNPALDASVSKTNPGLVFEIRAKRGAYLAPPLTVYDDEAELLLGEDTQYRVVKVVREAQFERDDEVFVRRTVVQLEQL